MSSFYLIFVGISWVFQWNHENADKMRFVHCYKTNRILNAQSSHSPILKKKHVGVLVFTHGVERTVLAQRKKNMMCAHLLWCDVEKNRILQWKNDSHSSRTVIFLFKNAWKFRTVSDAQSPHSQTYEHRGDGDEFRSCSRSICAQSTHSPAQLRTVHGSTRCISASCYEVRNTE